MCLLAFAYNHNADAPLIVISNRDEFYRRETLPMHWWQEGDVLAGRDQQAGGTWLGLSKNGRFAAVTNFRDLHRNGAPSSNLRSRGDLVTAFLCASKNVHAWKPLCNPSNAVQTHSSNNKLRAIDSPP